MLQWTPTELGGVPGKMNEYVHWGPIFYVCNSARNWVPFMYKGIYYIQQPWMSEVPKTFQQKKQVARNDQFLFILYLKKKFLRLTQGSPPTNGVLELWKNNMLQWTPTELGGVPGKIDEYVHWGPIFYVCNSARNWVPFMYKGIYYIRNSLWGAASLDVWSS